MSEEPASGDYVVWETQRPGYIVCGRVLSATKSEVVAEHSRSDSGRVSMKRESVLFLGPQDLAQQLVDELNALSMDYDKAVRDLTQNYEASLLRERARADRKLITDAQFDAAMRFLKAAHEFSDAAYSAQEQGLTVSMDGAALPAPQKAFRVKRGVYEIKAENFSGPAD